MAQLPASVRVGPHDYLIERWSVLAATAAGRYGECDHVAQVIRIRADIPVAWRVVEVLLHEVMHAILEVYGVKLDDHERVVTCLGVALTALHRDNPWLAVWIAAVWVVERNREGLEECV